MYVTACTLETDQETVSSTDKDHSPLSDQDVHVDEYKIRKLNKRLCNLWWVSILSGLLVAYKCDKFVMYCYYID